MIFLDLFAGIGGFRLGMEMAGHTCAGYVEIDKFARTSYEAIHDTRGEWTAHDIRTVPDDAIRGIGDIDVICGGFPCQAFSVAGKRAGFDDTRGTLFFEIIRFASILRPRLLFLENVPGLLNHQGGDTFETILRTLDEVGYDAEWDCLNSKDFGVPQNRERLFIIGHLRGGGTRKVFPLAREDGETAGELKELTSGLADADRVYDASGLARTLKAEGGGGGAKTGLYLVGHLPDDSGGTGKIYDPEGIAPTQLAQHGNAVTKVLVTKQGDELRFRDSVNCIDANYHKGLDNHQQRTGVMCIQKTHGATTSVHHDKTGTLQAARLDKVPMVVEEPRAVLTPDRVDKRQNGRRMKEPGEPMFTLTAQDLHGVALEVESGLIHSRGFETRKDGLSHCLKGAEGGSSKNFLLEKSIPSPDDVARTVRSGGHGSYDGKHSHGFLNTGCRIRKLTPRECWRLQGFPDWAFDRAKYYKAEEADLIIQNQQNRHKKREIPHEKRVERMSDSQLYKQSGNSVTVNVIYAIARELG